MEFLLANFGIQFVTNFLDWLSSCVCIDQTLRITSR